VILTNRRRLCGATAATVAAGRSKHDNALPLIITHGWPGSVIEQLKVIEPLTDPTAHGGTAVPGPC
jgi:hypothetical protein